jgi:hypothetical protein
MGHTMMLDLYQFASTSSQLNRRECREPALMRPSGKLCLSCGNILLTLLVAESLAYLGEFRLAFHHVAQIIPINPGKCIFSRVHQSYESRFRITEVLSSSSLKQDLFQDVRGEA